MGSATSQRTSISKGCEPLARVTEAGGLALWLPCPPTHGRRLGAGRAAFITLGRCSANSLNQGFTKPLRGVGTAGCRRPGSEGHCDRRATLHTPRASQGWGARMAPALTALGIHGQTEMQAQGAGWFQLLGAPLVADVPWGSVVQRPEWCGRLAAHHPLFPSGFEST